MPENLRLLGKTIPEAQHIKRTLTLREMQLPQDVLLTKQSLLRWLALSIGVLSERESRNTIVPILDALLFYQVKEKKSPTVEEIKRYLDDEKWGMRGKEEEKTIPEKAIRYHLGKLREIGLVEMKNQEYSFVLDPASPEIRNSVRYVIENTAKESLGRINNAFSALIKMYE